MKTKTFLKTLLTSSLILLAGTSSYGMQDPLREKPKKSFFCFFKQSPQQKAILKILKNIHARCLEQPGFDWHISNSFSNPEYNGVDYYYQQQQTLWKNRELEINFELAAQIANLIAQRKPDEIRKFLSYLPPVQSKPGIKQILDFLSACKKLNNPCCLLWCSTSCLDPITAEKIHAIDQHLCDKIGGLKQALEKVKYF